MHKREKGRRVVVNMTVHWAHVFPLWWILKKEKKKIFWMECWNAVLKAGIHASIDLKAPGSYSVGFILVLKIILINLDNSWGFFVVFENEMVCTMRMELFLRTKGYEVKSFEY